MPGATTPLDRQNRGCSPHEQPHHINNRGNIMTKALRAQRSTAQLILIKESKKMKIMQNAYDRCKNSYTKALQAYQKADLAHAMEEHLTIINAKKKKSSNQAKIKRSKEAEIKRIKKLLTGLPADKQKAILDSFNKQGE